ncbi:ABC transporter transmembrane domain-containing protein [Ferrimonas lipolytica]|uniref:Multidrug resistance-like ATP-binding protein MdlA n=1 Tax=Ferrimonas lipolytica TaxID=2724191 RepID=A0A6H1UCZ9_9GAMM|nr:ABC transporter transmembrane domain-containing protein [Ferrimonas lipolytica]QIZ76718.1 ATP-binding cassette domain-containing protein [Ferrimonas lipolytica]
MSLFLHLGWFFRKHYRTYLLALTMLITVALLELSVPYLVGQTLDLLLATDQSHWDMTNLYILAAIGLALYALRFGWRVILFSASYRLGSHIRNDFFGRLTKQGQAFFSRHSTGDLMAQATNDVDAVEMAAGEGILAGFDGLLTFVLILIMMLSVIDWRLTLVALIPFPFMGYSFYRISNTLHKHFKDSLDKFSRLNERSQQAIAGVRLVKAMGREQVESQQFEKIADDTAKSNFLVARSEAMYDPAVFISLSCATALTLGFGTWLIINDQLTIGELTSFSMYLGQLIWPMFAFGWLLNIIERGSAANQRLTKLLSVPDSVSDHGCSTRTGADISVARLSFTYPDDDKPSIEQINFELPLGKNLAIAGPTGSGKTTLLRLLMRQFDTDGISLDQQPLTAYRLAELRSLYSVVPQDPFLFSASIHDNIALGKPDATAAEVKQAAKLAAVDNDIMRFPLGYQTEVGERGVTLSGGQRQRIAIARALLIDAPILVLDDALSAVDTSTEQEILNHLKQQNRSQSRIIIGHRLSSLMDADEILVLNQGHIAERGSHQQLIKQDGWYSRMWKYQQMEEQLHVSH